MVTNNGLMFRFAVPDDTTLVLDFIRELARYEKMEELVVANEDVLRDQLFTHRRAEVIFAMENGREVGFALFFHNFSTFLGRAGLYLEDLYVKPECRGRGVGKAIFHELGKIARERACGRLEWWCLDWNEPARRFYKSLGAEAMTDWTVHRLSGKSLDSL